MSAISSFINFIKILQKCKEIEAAGQEVPQDMRNSLIKAAKDLDAASAPYLVYELFNELQVLTEALEDPKNDKTKACESKVEKLLEVLKYGVTTAGTSFVESFFSKLGENAADGTTEALKDLASKFLEKDNAAASTSSSNGNAGGSTQVEDKKKSGDGNAGGSAQVEVKKEKSGDGNVGESAQDG